MKLLLLILILSTLSCKELGEKQNKSDSTIKLEHAKCIELIFDKDSVFGNFRNHASENISLSESVINYTRDLESLDYSNCPDNFISAFYEHIEAWKSVTKITNKYPSLRGELHNIFSELEESKDSTEFKVLVRQIWDTWNKVEESTKQVNH